MYAKCKFMSHALPEITEIAFSSGPPHGLLPPSLEGRRVVQVAAGDLHSLFLAEDGAVLYCGYDYNGQL